MPLPHIFELARYGMFRSANLRFVDIQYVVAACLILTVPSDSIADARRA